jgi:hypothetical protein
MKRIIISLLALTVFTAPLVFNTPAIAACPSTLQLKDNAGTLANGKYTDDGSGNCMPNIAVQSGAAVDGWNVTEGTKADAAWISGSGSMVAVLKAIGTGVLNSIPAGSNMIGFTSNDLCTQLTKVNAAFGTAGATNIQLVAGVAAKKVYICSLSLISGAPASFSVIEGTGAACITANEFAIVGSTTAANGMPLPSNGGLTLGNGGATIGVTSTAANGVCILSSASVAFGGNITYVQQ